MNLSEFYLIAILNNTERLYSTINLFWEIIFFSAFLLAIWTTKKYKLVFWLDYFSHILTIFAQSNWYKIRKRKNYYL